ncbi:MAG: hypothetical protein II797_04300, partial [Clostridia bacterium]|nr:hypothetical protein [Clostridia bacterium]
MSQREFWLNRLNRRFSKYAIHNLMLYIVGVMVIVYIADYILGSVDTETPMSLSQYLYFDRDLVLQGQLWRVITFVFLPPGDNLIFTALRLYFWVLLGKGLEKEWGAFRFNLFYLCGWLLSLAGGFILGYAGTVFLNSSMFFAFALIYPNFELLLFFIIPVKIKYLAIVDAILYVIYLIFSPWPVKLAIVISLANLVIFFWQDIRWQYQRLRQNARMRKM